MKKCSRRDETFGLYDDIDVFDPVDVEWAVATRVQADRDVVIISGRMYTGRDAVHAHLMKHEPEVDLRGSVLYHCGPVSLKEGDRWRMNAAGPTTSSREEPYQADIIQRFGIRAIIGKGGMVGNVIRMSPPLNISKTDVDQALRMMDKALSQVGKQAVAVGA